MNEMKLPHLIVNIFTIVTSQRHRLGVLLENTLKTFKLQEI